MADETETSHEPTGKDIDRYLDMINPPGKIGLYQILLFSLVTMIFSMSFIMTMLAVYFGYTPPHHCKVDNMSYIPEEYIQLEGRYVNSSCLMYSNLTLNGSDAERRSVSCQDGWKYDRSQYEETVISEFNLVCEKSTYFETILTLSSALSGVATLFVSYLADRYGRRKVFIVTFAVDRIAGFMFAFMPTLPLVSATMGLASLAAGETIPILIMYEYFPMRYRGFAGAALNLIWICVACLLPLTGHLVRNWRLLIVTWNAIAVVVGVIGFWFIPESLTWLLSNRRVDEAETLIRKVAKFNKISLSEPILHGEFLLEKNRNTLECNDNDDNDDNDDKKTKKNVYLCCSNDGDDRDGEVEGDSVDVRRTKRIKPSKRQKQKIQGFREIIHSTRMIKITIITSGLYLVNCITFSGLLYITPYLIGNMHLNNFLMTIVELPAYLIAVFVVPRFGRKRPTIAYMLVAGIGLLFSLIELIKFEQPQSWIPIATALVGKFGISGSYAVVYIFSPELFPTKLRSTGVAVCRISEIIAQILVPYSSFYLVKYGTWIPRALYGGLVILMAIPVVLLPETKDKPLPETIQEIEEW